VSQLPNVSAAHASRSHAPGQARHQYRHEPEHRGVHSRSDAVQGLLLGEPVAISILRDQHSIFNEPFQGFTLNKFDSSSITV
jgi:hypothetical protein